MDIAYISIYIHNISQRQFYLCAHCWMLFDEFLFIFCCCCAVFSFVSYLFFLFIQLLLLLLVVLAMMCVGMSFVLFVMWASHSFVSLTCSWFYSFSLRLSLELCECECAWMCVCVDAFTFVCLKCSHSYFRISGFGYSGGGPNSHNVSLFVKWMFFVCVAMSLIHIYI